MLQAQHLADGEKGQPEMWYYLCVLMFLVMRCPLLATHTERQLKIGGAWPTIATQR